MWELIGYLEQMHLILIGPVLLSSHYGSEWYLLGSEALRKSFLQKGSKMALINLFRCFWSQKQDPLFCLLLFCLIMLVNLILAQSSLGIFFIGIIFNFE